MICDRSTSNCPAAQILAALDEMCSLGKKDAELLKQLRKLHGDGSKLSAAEAADAAAKADAKAGSAQSAAEKRAGALEGMRAYVARRGRVSFLFVFRLFVRLFVRLFIGSFVWSLFVRSCVRLWFGLGSVCVFSAHCPAEARRPPYRTDRWCAETQTHTRPIATTCLARRRRRLLGTGPRRRSSRRTRRSRCASGAPFVEQYTDAHAIRSLYARMNRARFSHTWVWSLKRTSASSFTCQK